MASLKRTLKGGVTRADLTKVVYERHGGLTKSEAAAAVNKIFDTMKVNLLEVEDIINRHCEKGYP